MKQFKLILITIITTFLILSCGSVKFIPTPKDNKIDAPIKLIELSETEEQKWSHLDIIKDTILGMSINRAYREIIKKKTGETVIVAVIDTGIDIGHEDLNGVIWINKGEIPNNGKDDDNNGYIDDINGWNFIGDTTNEQLECVRLIASGDKNNKRYAEAILEYEKEYEKAKVNKNQYEQILQQLTISDKAITKHLKKDTYTKKELSAIKTEGEALQQHIQVIKQMFSFGFDTITDARKGLKEALEYFTERINYNLNKDFKGRKTKDDINDLSDTIYGNGNVNPATSKESHGTHVAGIIAAKRNNNIGINGVANNVKIMVLRSVPNGDEYDKDIALSIRYAVDNGAKIINMSFGKSYSPHSNWVKDAVTYASQNDVLIVLAAGNTRINLDTDTSYPNDQNSNGTEISDTFLSVGATQPKYGSSLVASYSNYGKNNVDVFAPGSKIYSTTPENKYESQDGTSMAAPAVTGIAALIRSYYPNLSASQVKIIIMDSGLALKTKIIINEDVSNTVSFESLSKSGKLVNAYNALIMAKTISKQKKLSK